MSLLRPDRRELFRGGLPTFLSRVGRRVCHPVLAWESLRFFERDLTVAAVSDVVTRVPVEVRLATHDEMLGFTSERPGEAAERIAAGDLCFVGLLQGRIVHQTWLGTRPTYIPEIGARIRLEPHQTYLYASLTEEASRGTGVQAAVASFIVRWQKENGILRHFFFVKWHNYSARQVLNRVQPAPRAVRVVRRARMIRRRGFLVWGIPLSGDPLFDVDRTAVRPLGSLGYWLPGDTE